eukprot:CAMPEP_0172502116 /NCGR_PEP_ID=MMETSP1066-20121228/156892_1 /TAXON_ID=671091 /ORGANISM="Coscinodiscus wailesii, Strain CCMP2513" /LENGTH=361 /DNA_ID=CAMNT_0013277257 /DNA_START=42 /DNA_END=1127 /DNA_ORIENTATION=+
MFRFLNNNRFEEVPSNETVEGDVTALNSSSDVTALNSSSDVTALNSSSDVITFGDVELTTQDDTIDNVSDDPQDDASSAHSDTTTLEATSASSAASSASDAPLPPLSPSTVLLHFRHPRSPVRSLLNTVRQFLAVCLFPFVIFLLFSEKIHTIWGVLSMVSFICVFSDEPMGDGDMGEIERRRREMEEIAALQAALREKKLPEGVTEEAKSAWVRFVPRKTDLEMGELDDADNVMDEGELCSICLCEYEHDEVAVRIPCGHVYHDSCLLEWTENHVRCPLCNTDLNDAGGTDSDNNNETEDDTDTMTIQSENMPVETPQDEDETFETASQATPTTLARTVWEIFSSDVRPTHMPVRGVMVV